MALVLAAILNLDLWEIDFKSAFLNAPINLDIHIRQPIGFKKARKED